MRECHGGRFDLSKAREVTSSRRDNPVPAMAVMVVFWENVRVFQCKRRKEGLASRKPAAPRIKTGSTPKGSSHPSSQSDSPCQEISAAYPCTSKAEGRTVTAMVYLEESAATEVGTPQYLLPYPA